MYVTGEATFPVQMYLLINKTAPKAHILFNSCCPKVFGVPKATGTSRTYTVQCLMAMSDAGFQARLMFMSGQRIESSIR